MDNETMKIISEVKLIENGPVIKFTDTKGKRNYWNLDDIRSIADSEDELTLDFYFSDVGQESFEFENQKLIEKTINFWTYTQGQAKNAG